MDDLSRWLLGLEVISTVDRNNPQELVVWLRQIQMTFPFISYSQRVTHWRPKAQLIAQLLDEDRDFRVHEACWDMLTVSLKLKDELQKDPSIEENDTMDFGVHELGLIDRMCRELTRQPLRNEVACACLIPLTNIALCERHATGIAESGLVEALLDLVRRRNTLPSVMIPLLSLISLTNLAIHPGSHKRLLESGVIPVASQLIPLLNSEDMQFFDLGLSASFLVCRVAGRDEVGAGSELIHSNEALIKKLYWLFDQVLTAGPGPNGIILGSQYACFVVVLIQSNNTLTSPESWNPANIVLDISVLAVADKNKKLLKPFVPLLVKGLENYGRMNVRLTKFTVQTLTQLYFCSDTRDAIHDVKHRLLPELQMPYFNKADIGTYQKSIVLIQELSQVPVTVKGTMLNLYVATVRRLGRLFRTIWHRERAQDDSM